MCQGKDQTAHILLSCCAQSSCIPRPQSLQFLMFLKAFGQTGFRTPVRLLSAIDGVQSPVWGPWVLIPLSNHGPIGSSQISIGSLSGSWTHALFSTNWSFKSFVIGRPPEFRLGLMRSDRKALKEAPLSSMRKILSAVRMMSIPCWLQPNTRYHMSKSLDRRPLLVSVSSLAPPKLHESERLPGVTRILVASGLIRLMSETQGSPGCDAACTCWHAEQQSEGSHIPCHCGWCPHHEV